MSESNSNPAIPAVQATEPVQNQSVQTTQGQEQSPNTTTSPVSEAAQAVMKKYKVKVSGQDREVDEHELIRGYGHQSAANEILQQGKLAKKQAEEFLTLMRDPEKAYEVLRKLGHDPRELSEKYVARQIQEDLMDPRDKELRDTKAKLAQIEEMEKKQKEALEDHRNKIIQQKLMADYESQFVSAIKESGLPPTKPMIADMAKYIARSSELGFKMTALEAAKLVKEDIQKKTMSLIGTADGETLIKLLGEDIADKLRKWDTSRVKTPESYLRTPSEQSPPSLRQNSSSKKPMTAKEWRRFNGK